jgi:hypothetical protein
MDRLPQTAYPKQPDLWQLASEKVRYTLGAKALLDIWGGAYGGEKGQG